MMAVREMARAMAIQVKTSWRRCGGDIGEREKVGTEGQPEAR